LKKKRFFLQLVIISYGGFYKTYMLPLLSSYGAVDNEGDYEVPDQSY